MVVDRIARACSVCMEATCTAAMRAQFVVVAGLDDAVMHAEGRELGAGLVHDLAAVRDHQRAPARACHQRGCDHCFAAAGGTDDQNALIGRGGELFEQVLLIGTKSGAHVRPRRRR